MQQRILTNIPHFTKEAFYDELMAFMLEINIPFRAVDQHTFRRFLKFLNNDTCEALPHRTKTREYFNTYAAKIGKTLLKNLPEDSKVSVALDAWTSTNTLAFIAMTAHYINRSWNLQEELIMFKPLRGAHSGRSMATLVYSTLKDLGIETRLFALTGDNTSNNNTLVSNLEALLGENNIPWEASKYRIHCLAHVVQLGVKALLKGLQVRDKGVEIESLTVENLAKHKRGSRLDKILESNHSIGSTLYKVSFF